MDLHRIFSMILPGIAGSLILLLPETTSGLAVAQQRKTGQESAPDLILGTVASERGTTVSIPIYYQPGKSGGLRSVHLEVDFVSNAVKFTKADKGLAAQAQDYTLTVAAKELPPDEKKITRTRLSMDVSVPEADSTNPLPEGLWAFLNFRIPPDAKPFSISLNPIAISAQDLSKKPAKVESEAGKIIVSVPDEPLVGCFFFTH